jgi:putative transposase
MLAASARDIGTDFESALPASHWRKLWSTNLLERVNEEIKRRTRVVGIFPNDAAIVRLVGAVLLEQDEHWQLEGRRMFSQDTMAAIPPMAEELPEAEEKAPTKV